MFIFLSFGWLFDFCGISGWFQDTPNDDCIFSSLKAPNLFSPTVHGLSTLIFRSWRISKKSPLRAVAGWPLAIWHEIGFGKWTICRWFALIHPLENDFPLHRSSNLKKFVHDNVRKLSRYPLVFAMSRSNFRCQIAVRFAVDNECQAPDLSNNVDEIHQWTNFIQVHQSLTYTSTVFVEHILIYYNIYIYTYILDV